LHAPHFVQKGRQKAFLRKPQTRGLSPSGIYYPGGYENAALVPGAPSGRVPAVALVKLKLAHLVKFWGLH
jgi:hypothetical protein